MITRGKIYIHTKTGNRYVVEETCHVKIEGSDWMAAVAYRVPGSDTNPLYVRNRTNFEAKFTEDVA